MVYDIFGHLVADYNGASMEKENIYRSGKILAVYEAASTCYMTISDFVTAFYQGALHRDPTSTELSKWTSDLSKAQTQGHGKLIEMAQALGTEVFSPTVYSNTNHNTYVTDLYAAYLQRSPDSGGLQSWLNALAGGATFSQVRNGFAYSMEFQGNVVRLCSGTSSSTSTSANLKYVLTDLQGSGRVLMDNSGSGSSAIVARHDYLPFGEEIWAGVGLRTTSQKYFTTDKVRQRFALTERDEVTGLDHTPFRKYDSFAGRWTTPDPLRGSLTDPQSFNRYAYTKNDPVNSVDPNGLCTFNITITGGRPEDLDDLKAEMQRIFATGGHQVVFGEPEKANGGSYTINYVNAYPAEARNQLGRYADEPSILGVTIRDTTRGYVSISNYSSAAGAGIGPYFAYAGTRLGRLGAHEAITHGFLKLENDNKSEDITAATNRDDLVRRTTTRFDMDKKTEAELAKLCDKSKNPVLPPARPGPIVGGLPEPPISHFPGGDFPQLYPPGGPSELDWLIWLTDRMRPPPKKKEDEPA
jgi:RHS repeat-associated protein